MKIKNLLFLLTLLVFVTSAFAKKVEINEAKQVATKFYNQKYILTNPGTTAGFDITETFVNNENNEAVTYIFNFSNGGYVVVPADDRIYPVVGFSFESKYNPETIPDNALYVINQFGKQVTYVRTTDYTAPLEVENAWNNLRLPETDDLSFLGNVRDMEPIVNCLWNQDDPYNAMCPADPSGPGGHVYAGCVATAMSMIMYHWRYPQQGTGSHSYYASGYGTQTANFGATTYDFDGMVGSSDNTYNEMIALLQYHCGVSVDMMYAPDGSGAYSQDVVPAIKNYFGYASNAQILYKGNVTTWKAYLTQQMDMEQPVYYSGQDNSGGHAFVVDGYQQQVDDTYYHFNFGWSGSGNGFFLVSDAGGFNQSNAMIRNFIPDPNKYPYTPPQSQTLKWFNGTIDDCSGPKADYANDINCQWLISPQTEVDSVTYIKLTFERFETESNMDFVRIYDGENTDAPLLGEYSGSTLPAAISSTGNKMLVVFNSNESVTANGFMATYKAYMPTWCTGMQNYTEPEGSFDDGSANFQYNNNTVCMWRIQPQFAYSTTLYFDYLDTEAGADVVKVYNLANQQLLATLSGNQIPEPITSPSGQFFITFNTNSSNRGQGWKISYASSNVGINEAEKTTLSNLNIYPNPASKQLNLAFVAQNTSSVSISLTNVAGLKVYNETFSNHSETYNQTIDVSSFPKGMYFIDIRSENGNVIRKIVIE
jgi:hypothetical protein